MRGRQVLINTIAPLSCLNALVNTVLSLVLARALPPSGVAQRLALVSMLGWAPLRLLQRDSAGMGLNLLSLDLGHPLILSQVPLLSMTMVLCTLLGD